MKKVKQSIAFILLGLFLLSAVVYADQPAEKATLRKPEEVKAVLLEAEIDFDPAETEENCKAQLDTALKAVKSYDMNAVLLPVNGKTGGFFSGEVWPTEIGFDLVQYVLDKAKEQKLFVYAVLDARYSKDASGNYGEQQALSASSIRSLCQAADELMGKYDLDGLYLDGYCFTRTPASRKAYRAEGGAMGYDNWLRESITALTTNLSRTVKEKRSDSIFGLVVKPVWANQSTDPDGSATAAEFEMLTDASMDLDAVMALGKIDDVLVWNAGSTMDLSTEFKTVLEWWGHTAQEYGAAVTAGICNQKMGSGEAGWNTPDQVVRQAVAARETAGCKGAAFASLTALKNNWSNSTNTLLRYYSNQIEKQDILTDLLMHTPEKHTYTTKDATVDFYGESDRSFPLKFNGQEIYRNKKGEFTLKMDLKPGLNTFTLEHKGKTDVYQITREVSVIKSAAPTGEVLVKGGSNLDVTVMAYPGSVVTVSLNDVRMELTEGKPEKQGDEYVPYTGNFTIPAATEYKQKLGGIGVTAVWEGITQHSGGAIVTVEALVKESEPSPAPTAKPAQ